MTRKDMTPDAIAPSHHAAILRNNAHYVHWLSPLSEQELDDLLRVSDYARQLQGGEAVLIGYSGMGDYRHKHVDWLGDRLTNFFYIDRIIIGEEMQQQGAGRTLYDDVAHYARQQGHAALACEVNSVPDNPASHAFHITLGFVPVGDAEDPDGKAVRYYVRKL